MKYFGSFFLCAALLATTSNLQGQETYDVASLMSSSTSVVSNSSLARIETLEAELEALRSEMDSAKADKGMDCDCMGLCCCCGDGCNHLYFEYEQTFFQYKRADGARVTAAGPATVADFDIEASPRMTLGWMLPCGPGVRVRYWRYDHSSDVAAGPPAVASINAYLIDLEMYDYVRLNNCWTMELSGGVRYSGFKEFLQDARVPPKFCGANFYGGGGLFGIELRRCIGRFGNVYGRARGSILCGDKTIFTNDVPGALDFVQVTRNEDVIVGQLEIGLGWEINRTVLGNKTAYLRVGAEWQNWYNYSIEFDNFPANVPPTTDGIEGNADAGFIGFIVGAGIIL